MAPTLPPQGGTGDSIEESKVVGGSDVQPSDDISKTVVAVYDRKLKSLCSATLLSDDLVLTAAHCVHGEDAKHPSQLFVLFGENLRDTANVEAHSVSTFVENPEYEIGISSEPPAEKNRGDLALVKFNGGLPRGGSYHAAHLLLNESSLQKGTGVTVAGFGTTRSGTSDGVGVLRKANVSIEDARWSDHEILLNQTQGAGACQGDSGGPAYLELNGELYVFGITIGTPEQTESTGRSGGLFAGHDQDCSHFSIFTDIMSYDTWLTLTEEELERLTTSTDGNGIVPSSQWAPNSTQSMKPNLAED